MNDAERIARIFGVPLELLRARWAVTPRRPAFQEPNRARVGLCPLCGDQRAHIPVRDGYPVCGQCALDIPIDMLPKEYQP